MGDISRQDRWACCAAVSPWSSCSFTMFLIHLLWRIGAWDVGRMALDITLWLFSKCPLGPLKGMHDPFLYGNAFFFCLHMGLAQQNWKCSLNGSDYIGMGVGWRWRKACVKKARLWGTEWGNGITGSWLGRKGEVL